MLVSRGNLRCVHEAQILAIEAVRWPFRLVRVVAHHCAFLVPARRIEGTARRVAHHFLHPQRPRIFQVAPRAAGSPLPSRPAVRDNRGGRAAVGVASLSSLVCPRQPNNCHIRAKCPPQGWSLTPFGSSAIPSGSWLM